MDLLAADERSVTIRLHRDEEFAQLFSIVLSLHEQYEDLDQVRLGFTLEQVGAVLEQLERISVLMRRVAGREK